MIVSTLIGGGLYVRILLLLMVAATAFAQSDPTSRSWNQPVEPFRIAGNLYYVGASDITSYLIATPKGLIVIDGGFVETAPMIRANIAKLGFDARNIRILLSSHAHFDHAGGLAELKRISGAKFISSALDLPAHARGGLDDPQFGDRFPYPPIFADRIINDGERVSLGGTTLTAHITPGHTKGCTTWAMTVEKHPVVFVCSASVPSTYKLAGNPRYPNAADDYRRTFETLRSLPCDIFLASHGNFFELQQKLETRAFVDPKLYRSYVDESEKRFQAVLSKQSE
jgi:metallo-beta-lactamase class B